MARRKTGDISEDAKDPIVRFKPISRETRNKLEKTGDADATGRFQYASISVTAPSYYNPLYTPTSLQLPRDRKQINVWSFAPGTTIMMHNGLQKNIEDISIGDMVISANNIIRPITHIYKNKVSKNMFTITSNDSSLQVTEDHICYVIEDNDIDFAINTTNVKNFVVEKYASEIKVGDWVFRAIPQGQSILTDNRMAYLLGAYLADGYVYKEEEKEIFDKSRNKFRIKRRNKEVVEYKFNLHETYIVEKVIKYCIELGLDYHVSTNFNTHRIFVKNDEFAKICSKHCGNGSLDKILSNDILFSDLEYLQSFMNGYIDGDGSQSQENNMICFSTSSNNLSDQFKSIIFPRLGIIYGFYNYMAGKSLNDGVGYNANYFRIPRRYAHQFIDCATPIDGSVGVLHLQNKKRMKNCNGLQFSQVNEVSHEPYNGFVFDITVAEDFNVIANFISVRQCRHFFSTEAIPNAAVNLYASLPITNWTLESKDPNAQKYFEDMLTRLDFKKTLEGIALEFWIIGDVFIFQEPDEENATWFKITVLNPDNVEVRMNPLMSKPEYELIPDDDLKKIVTNQQPKEFYNELVMKSPELVKAVRANQNVKLSPDCISHLKNQPIPYNPFGSSLLKSVFKSLMYYEMLRRAQFTIAERYFAPLKIFKLGTMDEPAGPEEIAKVQALLEQTIIDPNLIMVATPRLTADWQGISGKSLNLANEYDFIERQIMIGLGLAPGFMDGSAVSSSLVGTAFVQRLENFRDTLKRYIEEKVFKPVIEWNGWTELNEETGEEELVSVIFKWDGLRLQDEASRQAALLSLRQNGILSAKSTLEGFHFDANDESTNILNERNSVFDAQLILARQIKLTQEQNLAAQLRYEIMRNELLPGADGTSQVDTLPSAGSQPNLPGQSGSTPPPGGNTSTASPGMPGNNSFVNSDFSNSFVPNNKFASQNITDKNIKGLLEDIYKILQEED